MPVRSLLVVALLVLAGCSTNRVSLGYQPEAGTVVQRGPAVVQLGKFTDARGVDANFLGAVRGGFGQQLKTLVTDEPVSAVVRTGFSQGLAARGLLRDATDAPYTMIATIEKFDCSQYVNREAHARIAVTVSETASGRIVMNETFQRDLAKNNRNLFDAGAFASTDDLRVVAADALREIVDTALDSPKLKQALAAGAKPS
jgi:hypothetical protein